LTLYYFKGREEKGGEVYNGGWTSVYGRIIFMRDSRQHTGTEKRFRVPMAVRLINTAIALVLVGLGIYHYTQPDAAWRSGTIESVSAILLLTAAYLVSRVKAMVINLVIAVGITVLGVRHVAIGGGWKSGTTELFFAVLLAVAAVIIYRARRK
jgi:hypothetical protein